MKKLTLAAAALLACTALAAAVSADDAFLDTYFPSGKPLTPANAPYVQLDRQTGEFTDDTLYIWWDQSDELVKLAEQWNAYAAADTDFPTETGFDYSIKLQVDCKIDDGKWQYVDLWDHFEYDYENYELRPVFEHVIDLRQGIGESKCSAPLSMLNAVFNDESNAGIFAGAFIRQSVNDDTRFRFDFESHTLSIRCRYLIQYSEAGSDEKNVYIGDWSPVASIGKDGTQSVLMRPRQLDAPVISDMRIVSDENDNMWVEYTLETPQNVSDAEMYGIISDGAYDAFTITTQIRIADGDWADSYTENGIRMTSGVRRAAIVPGVTENGYAALRVCYTSKKYDVSSDFSNVLSINEPKWKKASDWALAELDEALSLGLVPDSLMTADLTAPITREEFAAVSVKVYEALSGEKAVIDCDNPFEDTDSEDVLKAYSIGITAGMSETEFAPDALLNREQAATMLTRVCKKVMFDGWTPETDGSFAKEFKKLYVKPDPFADDEDISDWAKDSVYFMNAFEIVGGMGENRFAPRNITPEQEKTGYANATREQALLIAARMVEKLG